MCHAVHASCETFSRLLVPRIAVASADTDPVRVKILDRLKRAPQLGRDRDSFDHVSVVEQLLDGSARRIFNEFGPLAPAFAFPNKSPFYINARHLFNQPP